MTRARSLFQDGGDRPKCKSWERWNWRMPMPEGTAIERLLRTLSGAAHGDLTGGCGHRRQQEENTALFPNSRQSPMLSCRFVKIEVRDTASRGGALSATQGPCPQDPGSRDLRTSLKPEQPGDAPRETDIPHSPELHFADTQHCIWCCTPSYPGFPFPRLWSPKRTVGARRLSIPQESPIPRSPTLKTGSFALE